MTELDLYNFIKDNKIERHNNNGIIIGFIEFCLLEEFCSMVGHGVFDEGGYEARLKDKYLCIYFNDMCEYHGIEIKNVFNSDTQYY